MLCGMAALAGLNPFYENVQTDEGAFFAVRPFYSKTTIEEGEIRDYFWPIYSRKEFKNEQTSRALLFWWTHNFEADVESSRNRNWLLPFYFQGQDAHGENYFALFPFGGTIHEFLGRDRLSFVLFPIYGTGQINEVKTTNVLWPIYSRTEGEGIDRKRVFPFYGKSIREGQFEKKFVLWPFWTSAEYFHEENPGKAWILFPFYGRSDMEREKTVWVVPPFFRFTKGEKQNRTFCPWPFYQRIESERRNKLYFWPLWGQDQYAGGLNHRTFALWPFLWSERTEEAHVSKTRRKVLPFLFSEKTFLREEGVPEEEQVQISNYWKIWPLMSWQRDGHVSRFRMLELWPIKNSPPIERNWSPLWTLYKRTDVEGVVRKDILWFVWHSEREKDEGRSEWSLLKGLVGYKRSGEARNLRLFWFSLGAE